MKTAFSYIRFSTKNQISGSSLKRQAEASAQWCAENGYKLQTDVFFDSGKSAFKGKHIAADGELHRFLDLVKDGTIKSGSILLVENFDRLSRLPHRQSLELFLKIINAGVGVVFTSSWDRKIIDGAALDQDGSLLSMIIGEVIRAHGESSRKSKLIKDAKQRKASQISSGAIVTHNNAPKFFTWTGKEYVHNENTVIVKRIVKEYLSGSSLYAISKSLNNDRIPTFKTRGQWSPITIKLILRSRSLLGEFLGNKSFFPPIITQSEFDQCQIILTHNTMYNRGASSEMTNMLRGICFCSECGSKMQSVSNSINYRTKKKWNNVYRYYRCSKFGLGQKCNSTSMRQEDVELLLFGEYLLKNPDQLATATDDTALISEINTTKISIDLIGQKISSLLDMSDIKEVAAKIQKLNAERDELHVKLDTLTKDLNRSKISPQTTVDIRQAIADCNGNDDITQLDNIFVNMSEQLKNNELRNKLKTLLPTVLNKVIINTHEKTIQVINHAGKTVYDSYNLPV